MYKIYLLLSSCAIIDMPGVQSKFKCLQQSCACWSRTPGCKLHHLLAGQVAGTVMHCMCGCVQLVACSCACQQSLKSVGSFCSDCTVRGARSDARVGHRCMLSWQCSAGSLVYAPGRCCQDTPAGLLFCVGWSHLCIGRAYH